MTTHSLTLSPPEVRAALRGELGLVVRPVRPQPVDVKVPEEGFVYLSEDGIVVGRTRVDCLDSRGEPDYDVDVWEFPVKFPLGVPGTRLVGKEAWAWSGDTAIPEADRVASGDVWFAADPERDNPAIRWRSPATMPAWASRITLEVEGVRVLRLADITEEDANRAGDLDHLDQAEVCATAKRYDLAMDDARASFACAWSSRYGRRYPWESNPFVWAVGVKRV